MPSPINFIAVFVFQQFDGEQYIIAFMCQQSQFQLPVQYECLHISPQQHTVEKTAVGLKLAISYIILIIAKAHSCVLR